VVVPEFDIILYRLSIRSLTSAGLSALVSTRRVGNRQAECSGGNSEIVTIWWCQTLVKKFFTLFGRLSDPRIHLSTV